MSRYIYRIVVCLLTLLAGVIVGIQIAALGNYQGEGSWFVVVFFALNGLAVQTPIIFEGRGSHGRYR